MDFRRLCPSLKSLTNKGKLRFTASAFRKLPSIYVFSYFPFGFEGGMWDLIVSVPDRCLFFYFLFITRAKLAHSVANRTYVNVSNCPKMALRSIVCCFIVLCARHNLQFSSSGFLERCELKQFLGDKGVENPSDDDVEYILKCADSNQDGKIDILGKYEPRCEKTCLPGFLGRKTNRSAQLQRLARVLKFNI